MRTTVLAALLAAAPLTSFAQNNALAEAQAAPIIDEAPVVVTGVQPGPGMWKVRKGDHTMWVLGTISPLPKGMEWVSRDVEAVLEQAGEVLYAPLLSVTTGGSRWQALLLAPRLIGLRNNPDGATLQQIVSPQTYARWAPLKEKYIGRGDGIENRRPVVAAEELYGRAIRAAGLVERGIVQPVLDTAIKRHGVKVTAPSVSLTIKDPKQVLVELRQTRLNDLECFEKTVARLEADLQTMRDRANAWAIGDVETLRALPYSDNREACMRALVNASVVQNRADGDLEARGRAMWMQAAEKALADNRVTFAVLPMRELLSPDGYIAQLQAKGYTVEAP